MAIQLIDDEPLALKLLACQLENLGIKDVVQHERAHDALEQLMRASDTIDLVFCDLQMPQIDGVEFIRRLAHIGYTGDLVLVSGEDSRILRSAQQLASAHSLNVRGILHKPVTLDQLWTVLDENAAPKTQCPSIQGELYNADEVERAIRQGELVNFYQPQIKLSSSEVVGVEALVRWRHPRDGLVYPNQFIATAEQYGLIEDLTYRVLIDAIYQLHSWQIAGWQLHLAVNVSMENLASLDFPDRLEGIADNAGVNLQHVILEITESRLMKDRLASLDILTRLRLKHASLSIDDFGTGHSSLAQLRDVPFDELKIDRGFVHGACRDRSLRAIFDASLTMARQLGIRTVAEGVEDKEDWAFLHETKCDLAQGYYIAEPMPAEELANWLIEWQARQQYRGANSSEKQI